VLKKAGDGVSSNDGPLEQRMYMYLICEPYIGGVNECTFVGWWWLVAKVRVRWETDGVCGGRCLMRVTSMHAIKSRQTYV
jgi:hypothetical protein